VKRFVYPSSLGYPYIMETSDYFPDPDPDPTPFGGILHGSDLPLIWLQAVDTVVCKHIATASEARPTVTFPTAACLLASTNFCSQ